MNSLLETGLISAMNDMAHFEHVIPNAQAKCGPCIKLNIVDVFNKLYNNGLYYWRPIPSGNMCIIMKTLTGKTFTLMANPNWIGLDVKAAIQEKEGIPVDQQRIIAGENITGEFGVQIEEGKKIVDYGVREGSTLHLVLRLRGGGSPTYFVDPAHLDPSYDFDFRGIDDIDVKFYRGKKEYTRPIGSQRFAVKVLGKYSSNEWLGSDGDAGEWPVAYHGTTQMNAGAIAKEGVRLDKGVHFAYGRGIYCTPCPKTALGYASEFEFEGGIYKLILQTRVNPAELKMVKSDNFYGDGEGEYWLIPHGEHIRPYGICIYKDGEEEEEEEEL